MNAQTVSLQLGHTVNILKQSKAYLSFLTVHILSFEMLS